VDADTKKGPDIAVRALSITNGRGGS